MDTFDTTDRGSVMNTPEFETLCKTLDCKTDIKETKKVFSLLEKQNILKEYPNSLILAVAVHLAVDRSEKFVKIEKMMKMKELKLKHASETSSEDYLGCYSKAKQILIEIQLKQDDAIFRTQLKGLIEGKSPTPATAFRSVLEIPKKPTANASKRYRHTKSGGHVFRTQYVRKTPLTDGEIRRRERRKHERELCKELLW